MYGRHLDTLACLETLRQLPVPPHRLVLVLPPGDEAGNHTQLTHDPEVRDLYPKAVHINAPHGFSGEGWLEIWKIMVVFGVLQILLGVSMPSHDNERD